MDYTKNKTKNASDAVQLCTEQHLSIRRESAGGEMGGGRREEGGCFASGYIMLMGHNYRLTPVKNIRMN